MSTYELVEKFLGASDDSKEDFLTRYKTELLSDNADDAFMKIAGNYPVVPSAHINVMREVVRDARRRGIHVAWNDYQTKATTMYKLLFEFIKAPTLDASQLILEKNPTLNSNLGISTLHKLMVGASQSNAERDAAEMSIYMILLIRCRELGANDAFDEIREGRADYWALAKR